MQSHYEEKVYILPLIHQEMNGTHLIDLGRMKARVDLQQPSRFETETPELRIQYPKKLIWET